jgi:anti-sigma factor RsiW
LTSLALGWSRLTEGKVTCRELVASLMAYLDGELDPPGRRASARHLSRCATCAAYRDQYRGAMRAVGVIADEDSIPEPIPEDLIRQVLERARLQ